MTNKDESFGLLNVDNLLSGVNEWRNIQDIVRITIKSLCEVVRVQGNAIKEIEKQLSNRVTKNDLTNGLNLKANVTDLKRSLSEVLVVIDSKPSFEQIHNTLDDKVSKSEMQYLLSSKPNLEDIRVLIETKVSAAEYRNEISCLKHNIEETNEIMNQRHEKVALKDDIIDLKTILEGKANVSDVNDALNLKANKDSVISALGKKVNKTDYEDSIKKKVDILEFNNFVHNYDTNKVQLSEFKRLSSIVEGKCDKTEITLLETKADKKDLDFINKSMIELKNSISDKIREIDQDLNLLIENIKKEFQDTNCLINDIDTKKAEFKDLEKININLNKKIDIDKLNVSLSQVKNDVFECFKHFKLDLNQNKKLFEESMKEKINVFGKVLEKQTDEIQKYKDKLNEIFDNRKSDHDALLSESRQICQNFSKEISVEHIYLRNEISRINKINEENLQIIKTDIEKLNSQLLYEIEKKANLENLENLMRSIETNILTKYTEKSNLNYILKNIENDLNNEINKKVDFTELKLMMESKLDINLLNNYLSLKVNQKDFDLLKIQSEQILKELRGKLPLEIFNNYLNETKLTLEEIQKDLVLKADFNDIHCILKNKADIDEVNKALKLIHGELDIKTDLDQVFLHLNKFNNFMNNQGLINDVLCSENSISRYLWKSGQVKNGYAVPWEIQLVNTDPENFLWEKDKTAILIVKAGLYQISLGFFTTNRPTIQILINGETVLSSLNSTFSVHHSHKLRKSCIIPGITTNDYLVIPERSRVSVSFNGDDCYEGFIELKKKN